MNPYEQITQMVNRNYQAGPLWDRKERPKPETDWKICWRFCQQIFSLYGKELTDKPHEVLKRICPDEVTIPCIVLFKCGSLWHSGVLWPDGLHFLHAKYEPPLEYQKDRLPRYVIRHDRLTLWPWNTLLEGFYINV